MDGTSLGIEDRNVDGVSDGVSEGLLDGSYYILACWFPILDAWHILT